MLFNNCKAVRLVSAESQRVIPCSASTTKGIISENTITAVCLYLSMNLVEHTPASLTLLESGALYLMTFSRHSVRLVENQICNVVQQKAGLLHGCNDSREFLTDAPVIRTISSAGSYAVASVVSLSSSATPPQHCCS